MIPMFITSLENPVTILVILVVILILFGARRIPEVMHGLGRGLSEFKRGAREAEDDLRRAMSAEPSTGEPKSAAPVTPTAESPPESAPQQEPPG